jgi:hypothetical protein
MGDRWEGIDSGAARCPFRKGLLCAKEPMFAPSRGRRLIRSRYRPGVVSCRFDIIVGSLGVDPPPPDADFPSAMTPKLNVAGFGRPGHADVGIASHGDEGGLLCSRALCLCAMAGGVN